MRYGPMVHHGGEMGAFGGILHVLLIIALVLVIVSFIRRMIYGRNMGLGMRRGMMGINTSALDILKERYAKGEINKQEFEEKKKDLLS